MLNVHSIRVLLKNQIIAQDFHHNLQYLDRQHQRLRL